MLQALLVDLVACNSHTFNLFALVLGGMGPFGKPSPLMVALGIALVVAQLAFRSPLEAGSAQLMVPNLGLIFPQAALILQ